jgi:ribosomal protein L29
MSMTDVSDAQVAAKLQEAEVALVRARFKHSLGQLENTSVLRRHRRDIARFLGELRSRELSRDLAKDSLRSVEPAPITAAAGDEASSDGGFLSGIVDKLTQDS